MIPPLQLDDISYEDLVAQAKALLPTLCPDWTDHNPTDPGIALIELFAWLTEMVIYRVNRVPESSYRTFLQLLNGTSQDRSVPIDEAVRTTVAALRDIDRVVTASDLEYLTRKWASTTPKAVIRRVRCQRGLPIGVAAQLRIVDLPRPGGILVGVNTLLGIERAEERHLMSAPGHLTAIVLASGTLPENWQEALSNYLQERALLTTRIHVMGPRSVLIGITATLYLGADGQAVSVVDASKKRLSAWLDPLEGGPDKVGWPFGRAIHISDIYQLLDGVPGLDYVEDVVLTVDGKAQPRGIDMTHYEYAVLREDSETTFRVVEVGGQP